MVKLLRSYLTNRQQVVECNKVRSTARNLEAGSPQGSKVSPLLFLALVADLEHWVPDAKVLSYADDTTIYTTGKTKKEVKEKLQRAAEKVLEFMQATKLSANSAKTKFMMFTKTEEEPIRVGNCDIQESKEEVLLGINFNRKLTMNSDLETLESELRKRIGLLRRLRCHLPRSVLCQFLNSIFVSKMLYSLPFHTGEKSQKTLTKLHRQAMKAALKIPTRADIATEKLLQQTRQASIKELTTRSLAGLAWNCSKNWEEHPLTKSRVKGHIGSHRTRQTERDFPPQEVRESLITHMIEVWEKMPFDVKSAEDPFTFKENLGIWTSQMAML